MNKIEELVRKAYLRGAAVGRNDDGMGDNVFDVSVVLELYSYIENLKTDPDTARILESDGVGWETVVHNDVTEEVVDRVVESKNKEFAEMVEMYDKVLVEVNKRMKFQYNTINTLRSVSDLMTARTRVLQDEVGALKDRQRRRGDVSALMSRW